MFKVCKKGKYAKYDFADRLNLYTQMFGIIKKNKNMRANSKLTVLFLFCVFTTWGQELRTPKKIKVKGEYTHSLAMTVFPEQIDLYKRKEIYSFDKKKTNIGVVYENQPEQTRVSIYVYPAGDGYEGRLRKEYQKSMQSVANVSKNGIDATQFAVRHEGEKFICNGFKAIIKDDKSKYNSLTIYECGQWFLKVRITTTELDSSQIVLLEQKIYSQFDPTKLTETNPLNEKADIYFAKTAFRDSILLGSAMGSAYKKIKWALDNIKAKERASGFPDLYLNLQVESLKAFMEFQHRKSFKKSEFTKQYLSELQLISDAGFLPEFVMEQFGMILIIPENTPIKYEEFEQWKLNHKITIDLNQVFYVVSYGQRK